MNNTIDTYNECVNLVTLFGKLNYTNSSCTLRYGFPSRVLISHIQYEVNLKTKTIYYNEKEFENGFTIIDHSILEERNCYKMKFENKISNCNVQSDSFRIFRNEKPQIVLNEIITLINENDKKELLIDKLEYIFGSYLRRLFPEILCNKQINELEYEIYKRDCLLLKQNKFETNLDFIPSGRDFMGQAFDIKLFKEMGLKSKFDVINFLYENKTLNEIMNCEFIKESNIKIIIEQRMQDIYLIVKHYLNPR